MPKTHWADILVPVTNKVMLYLAASCQLHVVMSHPLAGKWYFNSVTAAALC